jgi:hypothetical protein
MRRQVFDIDVHHDRGVLAVRAPRRLCVPARLDQTHERIHGIRERGRLLRPLVSIIGVMVGVGVVVAFPVRDQPVATG